MTDQALPRQILAASPDARRRGAASRFDLPRALKRATQYLSRRLRRRRDRAHLAELPDYLLEDIGLSRADVPVMPRVGETLF